ncbi:MAG: ABC transporter permease [Desulfonauticus sp.]|nr:ABC transporter permease [Desulfonauticus sp.]
MLKSYYSLINKWLIALVCVVAVTSILLLFAHTPPLTTYKLLLKGSLSSRAKLARVFQVWVPLMLCSCGLLFTFSMKLWNIGIEGQVMLGAIGATASLMWISPHFAPWMCLILSLGIAFILGALWGFGSGLLKTSGGVNEIFGGLGLNFVAQGLILWLIFGPWKRPGIASMSGTKPFDVSLWLPHIHRFPVLGMLLALIIFILTAILLSSTRQGLKFKALGINPKAGKLYGLSPTANTLIAMTLAGGCAGLCGFFQVTGVYHRLIPAISSNYGYLSLLVVMLANYKWWPIPFISFFFACLNVGSIQLPLILKIDSSLSGVIQGICVLVFIWVKQLSVFERADDT